MKLPRFTATTAPPRTSGLARATDIGALTRTGEGAKARGIGAIGGALSGIAGLLFKAQQDRQAIDAGIQHAKATSVMNTAHTDDMTAVSEFPVESFAIRETIRTNYVTQRQKLFSETLKGLDNPRAKEMFSKTWEAMKTQQDTALYGVLTRNFDEQQKLDKQTEWEALMANVTSENLAEVRKGVEADIKAHLPLFGAAGVRSLMSNLGALTTKVREDTYKDAIYNGVSDLGVLTQQVQADDSVDKGKLLGWIRSEQKVRVGEAERVLEAQQEQDLGAINQAIRDGDFDNINKVIEASSLDEDTKQTRWKAAVNERQRRAQGFDIIEDPLKIRELNDLVNDISFDRIHAAQVLAQIDVARTPVEGDPLINQATHTRLSNDVRTTLRTVQDRARADMVREVKAELKVPETPGAAAIMKAGLKGQELIDMEITLARRAEQANAFEEALRDWEKENPKAQRDEYEDYKERNVPYFSTWEPGMPLEAVSVPGGGFVPAATVYNILTAEELAGTKGLRTMEKPESMAVFKEMFKRVPLDARQQYYERWYDIVFEEEQRK